VNAAALLGDPSGGEVAAGFRADAVLLDANPLEDIAAFEQIAGVLRGGVWFPGASTRGSTEPCERLRQPVPDFKLHPPRRRGNPLAMS
jgi:hypothetical protein